MTTIEEKYERYLNSIKKASKKYIETHRDLVNEKQRKYYHEKLSLDENYREMKRQYAKAHYHKKKMEKQAQQKEILGV